MLRNNALLTINDTYDWRTGQLFGTGETVIPVAGELLMSTGAEKELDGHTLTHRSTTGTSLWSDGNFRMDNGAVFTNAAGALFEVSATTSTAFSYGSGSTSWVNEGTLTKSGALEWEHRNEVGFNSSGMFGVTDGTIDFQGGTITGTVDLSPATSFLFNTGGSKNLGDGALFQGAGSLSYPGSNLSLTGTTTGTTFDAGIDFLLNDRTILGNGILTSNGTFTASGNARIDGTLVNGNLLNVEGRDDGGTFHTTLTVGQDLLNNGQITLTNTDPANNRNATIVVTNGTLVNIGTINSEAGAAAGDRVLTAEIDNRATGVINVMTNAPLLVNKSGADHVNSGTINATGANLVFINQTSFTQDGGVVNVTSPNQISFDQGTYFWDGGTIEGGGQFSFSNSNLINGGSGTKQLNNIDLNPANLTVGGTGTLEVQVGANLTTAGISTIDPNATIDLQGGNFTPTGTSFNVNGQLRVAAGNSYTLTLGGTHTGAFIVEPGATLDFVSGMHNFDDGALLTGTGNYAFSGGTLNFIGTGAGSTIDLPTTITFTNETIGGPGLLNNDGTLIIEGFTDMSGVSLNNMSQLTVRGINGTDTTWTFNTLNNSGILDLLNTGAAPQASMLIGDITNTGTINVLATGGGARTLNGTLTQTAGTLNVGTPFTLGQFDMNGGTAAIDAVTTIVGPFNLTSGSAAINALMSIGGPFGFNGGTLSGPGSLDVTGALNVGGAGTKALTVTTDANGVVIATGNTLNVDAITLTSTAATDVAANANFRLQNGAIHDTVSFNTAGFVNVDAGSTLSSAAAYTHTGTNPTTVVNGTLSCAPMNLNAVTGVLAGTGQINGDVNNRGIVRAGTSPGTLNINGNFTLLSTSLLDIDLGGTAPGQFDVINVTGIVTFAGALNALEFGTYVPVNNDSFQVMNFASSSGNFASINNVFPNDPAAFVTPQFNPASLVLGMTATTAAPPPPSPPPAPAAPPPPAGAPALPPPAAGSTESITIAQTTIDPILVLANSTTSFVITIPDGDGPEPIDDSEAQAAARISCN